MNQGFEDRVKNHYLKDQGDTYHLVKRKLSDDLFPWVIRLRAEKFAPYISANDDVLEYGAGNGWNLMGLKCKTKTAFDLSTLNKERMEANGIKFITNESDIPKGSFDKVVCHHVLEHVPFPGVTLELLKSFLKTGGELVLVVPLEGQTNNEFNKNDREGHIYAWTSQTLGNLVDRAGFVVKEIKVVTTGYDRFAADLAGRFKLGESGFRLLRRAGILVRPFREIILIASKAE